MHPLGGRKEGVLAAVTEKKVIWANTDMSSSPSSFFFDSFKIRTLVPARFGIVVIGDGIESRFVDLLPFSQEVSHTDDGRRVEPSAQFSENGSFCTKPATY